MASERDQERRRWGGEGWPSSPPTSVATSASEDKITSTNHLADAPSSAVGATGPIFKSATPACVALNTPIEKTPCVTIADRYVGCSSTGKRAATSSTAPIPFCVNKIVDPDDSRGSRGLIAAAVEGDFVVRIRCVIAGP
ncbi:hypothetical protein V501_09181, partial [Pseudogymnoascus sp. VKM F-4519 (FW-2642)]